jgi:putative DNA methylase
LGLESYASDLNPVAVTINKAMIEIPPRFAGRAPVGPLPPGEKQARLHEDWRGARGLAEDVRRYGAWMRAEAERRIGHLYPKITVTAEMAAERPDLKPLVGQSLTVIAWLWARTVKSPNPAFSHIEVPLASTFVLSSKEGKQAYAQPVVNGESYRFAVRVGAPDEAAANGTKANGRGANFRCVLSDTPISGDYIKSEGQAGRIGTRLLAIVAEGSRGRIYLSPTPEHESAASSASPTWVPSGDVPARLTGGTCVPYGMTQWSDLFTQRQLMALTTFSDLANEVIEKVKADALAAGLPADDRGLDAGGTGAAAYAEAVGLYLAFATDKVSDRNSSLCAWASLREHARNTFGRQSLPMTWDFAESNPLSDSSGNFEGGVKSIVDALAELNPVTMGAAHQADAQTQKLSLNRVVSTDPPYYDNIAYADLSDFFYVWLRKTLRDTFPSLFATLAVPKAEELVATAYRHGSREKAEAFFLRGMTQAMHNLAERAHPAFPVTIYYAFKQSETKNDAGTSSTGWETFLQAVIDAGFAVTGTWPMRTELERRMVGADSNTLASSIILVCRQRAADAPTISRREFIRELNAALPDALDEMTRGGVNSPVAPVDLSQAIIGPGMAIFSQYAAVLEADGTPMSVKTALQLINRFLAEDDFDHDTQFCLHWFEQQGWATGKFGEADVLARAKGTSVTGLQATGVVASGKGELRLLRWAELPPEWAPETDSRLSVWEALHHLIRALNQDGESAAGALLARMPARAEPVRALAYRLYTLCERKGWAEDARAYNELVTAWSAIEQAASEAGVIGSQAQLDI